MKKKNQQKNIAVFKPLDALIALAVFAVAAICIGAVFFQEPAAALKAVVRQDGKIVKEMDLQTLKSPVRFTVGGDVPLTVLFENDGARVETAQCKDKICVDSGKLTKAGQTAVCLPARVTLELTKTGNAEDEVDVVTG